jgi:hypothetical protein
MRKEIDIPSEFRDEIEAICKQCVEGFAANYKDNFGESLGRVESLFEKVLIPSIADRLIFKYQEEVNNSARKCAVAAIDALLGLGIE